MAILEKKIKPSLRLKISEAYQQGKKDSDLVNQLLISEGKGGSPNTPTPDWDKDWPKPGTKPRPEDRPNIPTKLAGAQDINTKTNPLQDGSFLDEDGNRYIWSPRGGKFIDMGPYDPDFHGLPLPLAKNRNGMMVAHHTEGRHFAEPSIDELIDGIINGEIPRGTLGDEETENRLIQERQNQLQQQSLMINPQEVAMADKMYRVTDWDKKQNNEAWKQFIQGNPNYFYKPVKGRA